MASGEVNEFDIMRQRIRERQQEGEKTGREQVKQQFASRGTLGSGVEIRAQERERARIAQQAQEERRDVLVAEAGVRRQEREAQRQREFAKQERLSQQQFARQERLGQQKFATGERRGTQEFQSSEAVLQRRFAAEESRLGRELTQSEGLAQRKFMEKEAQLNRELTTSEREATQAFASAEAALGREFTTEERIATQSWMEGQEEAKRVWQGTQNELERTLKTTLQQNQLDADQEKWLMDISLKAATLFEQQRQFNTETDLTIRNNVINARTALKTAGYTDAQIGTLLAGLGLSEGYIDQTINAATTDNNMMANILGDLINLEGANTGSPLPPTTILNNIDFSKFESMIPIPTSVSGWKPYVPGYVNGVSDGTPMGMII